MGLGGEKSIDELVIAAFSMVLCHEVEVWIRCDRGDSLETGQYDSGHVNDRGAGIDTAHLPLDPVNERTRRFLAILEDPLIGFRQRIAKMK